MSRAEEAAEALGFPVSRETLGRLDSFSEALVSWSRRINLIAPNTCADVWSRHIIDSLQIVRYVPAGFPDRWCDIGSGGGLPGIVVAIVASERAPETTVLLVEADKRKSAFLKIISRELGLNTEVVTQRIETADDVKAGIVSARALAPMPELLGYCARHLAPGGACILAKGRTWRQELEAAQQSWHFECDRHDSIVDRDSVVLVLRNLRRLGSLT